MDIWRRNALDSISEDEEEEDEETETKAVDKGHNHVNLSNQSNHCYGNSARLKTRRGQSFYTCKKPNHFRVSGPWSRLKNNNQTDWKTRANHNQTELSSLLPEDEDDDSSPKSPPLQHSRQLAVDVNAGSKNNAQVSSPEEKSSNEPFSDRSLEWEHEKLTLNNDENPAAVRDRDVEQFEMENLNPEIAKNVLEEIAEEREPDECDKILRVDASSENMSINNPAPGFCDSPASDNKHSREFSKHLFLIGDQDELDGSNLYFRENTKRNTNGDYALGLDNDKVDLMRFVDEVKEMHRGIQEDENQLGYTDFRTRNNTPMRSGSVLKSSVPSVLSSPKELSTRGSSRSGTYQDSVTDRFRQSGFDSQYGSPDEISEHGSSSVISLNNEENSMADSKISSNLTQTKKLESPRKKVNGIFAEFSSIGSPGGSLKDSRVERRRRHGGLRRTLTEVNYPSDSGSSLNGKPMTLNRRRKVSGVMQPPTIFAPLVANVNNPYKDFVPPVRESAITCDCPSGDQILGMSCHNCLLRKSDDTDSAKDSASEGGSEDQIYKNAEDLYADKQLLCFSNSDGSHDLKDDDYLPKRTFTYENSKRNETQSDLSLKVDDTSHEGSSFNEPTYYFQLPFWSFPSIRRPSISGAYSTQCIEKDEIPESDELERVFRPMRSSFSEPHLSSRRPLLPGGNGSATEGISLSDNVREISASGDVATRNLEDIFKDVCCTKEAIEKLELILKSPEPEFKEEEIDTKHTVEKLNEQVLHLNREVASLSTDVKTVLELLEGLKNGQVKG